MRCPSCASDNPDGLKFCEQCAAPLKRRCARCRFENSPAAKFCGQCAAPLDGVSPPLLTVHKPLVPPDADGQFSGVPEGERKTVTALFADIKGSTELVEGLDPEEARAIIDPALKLMIEAVEHYGGYVAQSTGDGIFAMFGAPVAHEDHPQRALYAALRMQDELRRYGANLQAEGRAPVEIRVGANTGEVVVRSILAGESHNAIGHTTNLASRLQALARTGSVVISESTRKLTEGYFALKPLGASRVRGIAEAVNVYEVTGLGPLRTRLQRSAVRGYTKFVGREREMDAMRQAAELAQAGHGQLVAAVAEPGVGKSRLFHEFKARNQSGWMVLEAFSFSHGKATAYLPLLDLMGGYFGIEDNDDTRKRREKVAGRIAILDRSLEDALPYLFGLLGLAEGEDLLAGMDAQLRRRHTLEVLKRILLRESLNQPLMVIFEDLHWIDEETQAFLNRLADSIGTAKILLLVNYRPEYSHSWGGKTYYIQLRLDPLGKESAGEMLDALLGVNAQTSDDHLAPLKRLIIDKTDGTPLFMEEIVQALLEEGVLVRNGAVKLIQPLDALKVPPTVQGILTSRIDRQPAEEKELLQTLAVIGMDFSLALVRKVIKKPDAELNHRLNALQLAEFIYEQPAAGDIEYTFKHALTRDVAYNSLLTERRKLLHERTAQGIEALYRERLQDHYADLAHHYRSSNNAAKAIEYLGLAGEQAVDRGAYAQALANVEPALKFIERLPGEMERLRAELRVRLMEGMAAPALHGLGSTERLRTFQRVCELSERLGDDSSLIQGLFNVAGVYLNRGEASHGFEITRRAVELAERSKNPENLSIAQSFLAGCAWLSGDLPRASLYTGELMKRIGPQDAPRWGPINMWVHTVTVLAVFQHELGQPDEALKLSSEAIRRGRILKHPLTLAYAIGWAAALRYERREPEIARELAQTMITLAEEHGLGEAIAVGRSWRGWATAELGQGEAGVSELEANASLVGRLSGMQVPVCLAQAYMRTGGADRALAMLNEALTRGEATGLHKDDAELHRLKGEAMLTRGFGARAEAEDCFRKAIEIAHGQSAKWWELRATTSLARLLAKQGKRYEARAMLAEIYNWFTEGFDTADLKDAKTLLDELSA